MSQWWACGLYAAGTTALSFVSTSNGVSPGASPVRLLTRNTWVSTAMVGSPKATLRTTLAVLRPTPGTRRSLIVVGSTRSWTSVIGQAAGLVTKFFPQHHDGQALQNA